MPYSGESEDPYARRRWNAKVQVVDEHSVIPGVSQDRRIEELTGDKPPEPSDTAGRHKDAAEVDQVIPAEEQDAEEAREVHPIQLCGVSNERWMSPLLRRPESSWNVPGTNRVSLLPAV